MDPSIIMSSLQTTGRHKQTIIHPRGHRKKRQGRRKQVQDPDYYNPYPYQENVPVPKNSRDIYTDHRQKYVSVEGKPYLPLSPDITNYEYDIPDYDNIGLRPIYYNTSNIQSINNNDSAEIGPQIHVKGEEVGIVIVVLLLWVGAIALFFHRWGKIRMLEPYQPKFCESHRPSCAMVDSTGACPRSHSKLDLSPHFAKCNYQGVGNSNGGIRGLGLGTSGLATGILNTSNPMPGTSKSIYNRPRQNSVFVTSIHSTGITMNGSILKSSSRKTKSAYDLSSLVLSEEFQESVQRNSSKNSITHL